MIKIQLMLIAGSPLHIKLNPLKECVFPMFIYFILICLQLGGWCSRQMSRECGKSNYCRFFESWGLPVEGTVPHEYREGSSKSLGDGKSFYPSFSMSNVHIYIKWEGFENVLNHQNFFPDTKNKSQFGLIWTPFFLSLLFFLKKKNLFNYFFTSGSHIIENNQWTLSHFNLLFSFKFSILCLK